MKLIRDGVALGYEESGAGAPPIVFVHGWCCDRSYFEPQVDHFSRGHRCIAVDLRGHGESDAPEQEYTIAGFADDVAWICGQLGAERPLVVGHSMGGAVALSLSVRHPGLARGIVMLDGAIMFSPSFRGDAISAAFRTDAYLDVLRQMFAGMFLASDTVRKQQIIDSVAAFPRHVAMAEWDAIVAYDSRADAAACRTPAMYVGAHSPAGDMRELAGLMPHMVPAQTAGAGHFHQLEAPDQVNAMIERFLTTSCAPSK